MQHFYGCHAGKISEGKCCSLLIGFICIKFAFKYRKKLEYRDFLFSSFPQFCIIIFFLSHQQNEKKEVANGKTTLIHSGDAVDGSEQVLCWWEAKYRHMPLPCNPARYTIERVYCLRRILHIALVSVNMPVSY